MVRSVALVAAAALALGAGPTPAGNRAAARAEAPALLGRLALPPGAAASATEPAGDGGQLAQPFTRPATPNLVDVHGWWTAPGRPDAVLAYVRAHPPSGSRPSLRGAGLQGFGWRPRRGVLSTRELVVQAVALPGGSTGVRADAEVVWIAPRPARERIPAGITRLRVTARHRHTVSAARRIRRVVHLLNGLPLAQPGAVNCPAETSSVRLAFYRGHREEAVAVVEGGGCQDVALRLRGRRQPPLTGAAFPGSGRAGSPPLLRQLERALGLRLSRGSAATPARSG